MLPQTCATPSQPETARAPEGPQALPYGHSLLQGQYRIERELMAGGFGITYLARDSLDRQVVIKECFPAGFCIRDGVKVATQSPYRAKSFKNVLRHFLREAQWLARAQHDNIVNVHQVFKENATAYIAMECIQGCDLVTLRDEDPGRLSQAVLTKVLDQALAALTLLHGMGVLHRDISPDNFLIDAEDHLTLIDFGSACGVQGDADTALGAMLSVKDGYSPHEFYQVEMPQRVSCDLYALGATLYFLITGQPPAHAQDRLKAVTAGYADPCPLLEEGTWPLAPAFLRGIDKAMSILPGMRFQSASEWRDVLEDTAQDHIAASHQCDTVADIPSKDPEVAPVSLASIPAVPEAAISDLVATTNRQLTPGDTRPRPPETPTAAEPQLPTQMVDIFGEPIADVDRWLEAQDRLARSQASAEAAAERPAKRNVAEPQPPARHSAESKVEKRARDTGWKTRVARIWGTENMTSDNRPNAMTANGKTT